MVSKKDAKTQAMDALDDARSSFVYAEASLLRRQDRILENAAFLRGFQYRVLDGEYQSDSDDSTGESNEVQNIVRAFVRSAVSATLRQIPNPEVPAAKSDQRSRAKSDAVEALAKSFSRNGTIDFDEFLRCLTWSATTGLGWMKAYWDKAAGKPIIVGQDPTNEPMVEYPGDIRTAFVSSIDLLPDPAASCPRDVRYVFHQKLKPASYLERKFRTDFFGEETHGRWELGTSSQAQIEYESLNDRNYGLGAAFKEQDQLARIVERWEMPDEEMPRGRLTVYSAGLLIYTGPNPYWPPRLPFVPFYGDNLVPGTLSADGLAEDIKPIQRSINRTVTKEREWVDKILNSHLLAPIGSGITQDNWDDIPGQVINYAKGLKPEYARPPDIPSSMFNYTADLLTRAKEITGYSDISRGDVPQGVSSGRAIAFLRENEQGLREPAMILFRKSYIELLQQCTYLARQYYDEGRMVRTIGPDYRWTVSSFKSEDFDWDNDLVPEVFSGAPNSHALRFSEVMEMYGAKMLDPNDPQAKAARQILSADYAGKLSFDPNQEDRLKARREDMGFLSGTMPMQAREFDEHEIHIEEHNKFRKSQDYEDLAPEQQAQVDQHCEMHESYMRAQEMQYGQSTAAMGGQGGAPGPQAAPPGLESPPNGGNPTNPTVAGAPQQEALVQKESANGVGNQPPV